MNKCIRLSLHQFVLQNLQGLIVDEEVNFLFRNLMIIFNFQFISTEFRAYNPVSDDHCFTFANALVIGYADWYF